MSSKDFPQVKLRDIVEIYHPDVAGSRVLLQVHSLKEDMQAKGQSHVYIVIYFKYLF